MIAGAGRAAVVALVLSAVAAPLGAQDLGIRVGAKAPAAQVETLDGKPVDLGQFIGKTPVILEFWATWCPNCQALEPQLLAAYKQYGGKVRFMAIAVSVNQSQQRAKLYIEKHGIPFDVYWDGKGNAADVFDAPATSYIVAIDKSGTVVYTGLGADQKIDPVVQKVLK
jgi:thiol-disulfide isomerase/thioredoxin